MDIKDLKELFKNIEPQDCYNEGAKCCECPLNGTYGTYLCTALELITVTLREEE